MPGQIDQEKAVLRGEAVADGIPGAARSSRSVDEQQWAIAIARPFHGNRAQHFQAHLTTPNGSSYGKH